MNVHPRQSCSHQSEGSLRYAWTETERVSPGEVGGLADQGDVDPVAWGGAKSAQILHVASMENLPGALTFGAVYKHALWNTSRSRYRIGADDAGRCPCTEDEVHPHTGGILHMLLDLPQPDLEKIVETFAKVQQNAEELTAIK